MLMIAEAKEVSRMEIVPQDSESVVVSRKYYLMDLIFKYSTLAFSNNLTYLTPRLTACGGTVSQVSHNTHNTQYAPWKQKPIRNSSYLEHHLHPKPRISLKLWRIHLLYLYSQCRVGWHLPTQTRI